MLGEPRSLASPSRPPDAVEWQETAGPPRGLRGLLAIFFLNARRGSINGFTVGLACLALWAGCLALHAPVAVLLFSSLVVLPAGLLVLPVIGVLQGQRLPLDYRQLGVRSQLRLWLRGPRPYPWPLPAGALTDPGIRRHAPLIAARAERIASLARGARSALTAELGDALAGVRDPAVAATLIDEAADRITRWEAAADGLPPIGAKLYLRHDPISRRAARARSAAARLGVPSDSLNYFWRGQVLLLPPARSHHTIARLIDAVLAGGVAGSGSPLPLQITIQGDLGDDAKLIALTQLTASGLDLEVRGPERRGDEGNLITRGRRRPEQVTEARDAARTDFLYSQVWAGVPEIAAAGYADQHHRDLRVVQTFAAAVLASARPGPRAPRDARLAAAWQDFAAGFLRLCALCGVEETAREQYIDRPFAAVRPSIETLLARKAEHPILRLGARRLRDRILAQIEFTLATARLMETGGVRRVRLRWAASSAEEEMSPRAGLRRARRAIRSGARVALITRRGRVLHVLLDQPSPSER